jgi:hypothetical protein
MRDLKNQLKSVADRGAWAARGASFVTKAKATKAVWFPPEPVKASRNAASTAKRTTKRATKKTAGAAKKSVGSAKKAGGA